jgi:hypothetical protein
MDGWMDMDASLMPEVSVFEIAYCLRSRLREPTSSPFNPYIKPNRPMPCHAMPCHRRECERNRNRGNAAAYNFTNDKMLIN